MSNGRKKAIAVVLALVIAFVGARFGYQHVTDAKQVDGKGGATVYEISRVIDDYLDSKGEHMRKGSLEYMDFLRRILMSDGYEDIKALPEYEDIMIYASDYVVKYPFTLSNFWYAIGFTPTVPKEMRDKTIAELVEMGEKERTEQEAAEKQSAEENKRFTDAYNRAGSEEEKEILTAVREYSEMSSKMLYEGYIITKIENPKDYNFELPSTMKIEKGDKIAEFNTNEGKTVQYLIDRESNTVKSSKGANGVEI